MTTCCCRRCGDILQHAKANPTKLNRRRGEIKPGSKTHRAPDKMIEAAQGETDAGRRSLRSKPILHSLAFKNNNLLFFAISKNVAKNYF